MKLIYIDDIQSIPNDLDETVACIGYFDGLHKGHQALIHKTQDIAQSKRLKSCLITFDPDPWTVLRQAQSVNHITPMIDKQRILSNYGLDVMMVIRFSLELAHQSPQAFIEQILLPLNVKALVCGSDYRFGSKGSGTPDYIIENYYDVLPCTVIDLLKDDLGKIGSTHIIQHILKGDMTTVSQDLQREYCVSGKVVHGRKQGRLIGFPTANLELLGEYVIPKPGVYAGFVAIDGDIYQSIINIGYNPTFNTLTHLAIETHILDFNADIYDKIIIQSFSIRIRDELKFDSIDALVKQMKSDEAFAREYLATKAASVVF